MSIKFYKSGDALRREMQHTRPPFPMSAIWYLGESSVAIRTSKHFYLFDPVFQTDDGKDMPFQPEGGPVADYVFLSDFHSMIQIQSLRRLSALSDQTQFIVPQPHVRSIREAGLAADRVYGAQSFQYFSLDGAQVVPVAEDFGEKEGQEEGARLGYAIRVPGMVLYQSGNAGRVLDPSADLSDLMVDVLCGAFPKRDRRIGELARRLGCDLILPMYPDEDSGGGRPENIEGRYHELLAGERYFYQK